MTSKLETIREEELLLLKLCRLSFSESAILQLKNLVSKNIDWDYFITLANAHGISALAYYNIKTLQLSDSVPNNALICLKQCLFKSIAHNASLANSLKQILHSFNNANIKTVLLKGMDLEMTLYGNKGLRQMSDIDVLLDKNDCTRACDILNEEGFCPKPLKSPLYKYIYLESGKHLPSMIKGDVSFEIHNDLFKTNLANSTREYFNNATTIEIMGEKVWVGSPQDKFIFLLKHLINHEIQSESQLRLYSDLVVLLDSYESEIINLQLVDKAKQAGVLEIMASRLIPLKEYWGFVFPDYINEIINTLGKPSFMGKFISFLKSPKNNPKNRAILYRYHIKQIPGFRRRFLFVLGDLFPSLSFMKNRYSCNGYKVLLHYPQRWGKLLFLLGSYKKADELL